MNQIAQLIFITLFIASTLLEQEKKVVSVTNGTVAPSAPAATSSLAEVVKIRCGLSNTGDSSERTIANIAVLNTVGEIRTFTQPVTLVLVTDPIRGGQFNVYTGSDAVDGGIIFLDALNRKWKRVTIGESIHIKWYGVTPYNNNVIDVAPSFRKAIAYIKSHRTEFGILQLEPCLPNTWYFILTPISLSGIKMYGAGGAGRRPSTHFTIAGAIIPFDIRDEYTEVKDISVTHYAIPNSLDSNFHTFKIRTFVKFENVSVYQNEHGNGFDISGCGSSPNNSPDSIFGNTDHSIFLNCQAQYCLNGAEIYGCDANAMLFQNCNFAQNYIWGVYDNGFLGNTYLTTHWADNSSHSNSGARIGTDTYYPNPDSLFTIKGKYPPTNPTYWYRTNFTGGNEQWDSTKQYWGGGPLWANNPNSNHAIISCYTEDFQANSIISPRSAWYEGTNGSPVIGGSYEHTVFGTKIFTNVSTQSEVFHGSSPTKTPFKSTTSSEVPMLLETDFTYLGIPITTIDLKNATNISRHSLIGNVLQWQVNGIDYFRMTPTAFLPRQNNMNLADATTPFGNIFTNTVQGKLKARILSGIPTTLHIADGEGGLFKNSVDGTTGFYYNSNGVILKLQGL